MVTSPSCYKTAKHIEELIYHISKMKHHAIRELGYSDNSLMLLVSEEAFYRIRQFDRQIYDGRQIMNMDYYIIDGDDGGRRGRRDPSLYADLLIKTRLAHYQDIPPATADEQPIYKPKDTSYAAPLLLREDYDGPLATSRLPRRNANKIL